MAWLGENWHLALYALAGLGVIGRIFFSFKKPNKPEASLGPTININNTNVNGGSSTPNSSGAHDQKVKPSILFIDDDISFPVVKILRKAGWANTKIVKDIVSLDTAEVLAAQILFVDIQGVGKALNFKEEGLGLAAAIKKKHPTKKVVIYSSVPEGNMFHEALKLVDATLQKSADPYEFQMLVEKLTEG
jgi:hypothetical protein